MFHVETMCKNVIILYGSSLLLLSCLNYMCVQPDCICYDIMTQHTYKHYIYTFVILTLTSQKRYQMN